MRNPIGNAVRVLVLAGCIGLVAVASAAGPDGIDYQGYLTNSDGSAFDGDVTMTFAAYHVDIGGAPLWSQSQTVPVEQGLFSVTLGTPVNPFPASLFDNPVYVGLTVSGEELLPRRALNSTAYSFKASDANTLGGATAAALNQSAHVVDTSNPHAVTAAQTGAATTAQLVSLQNQLNAALATISALETQVDNNEAALIFNSSRITNHESRLTTNENELVLVGNSLNSFDSRVSTIEGNTVLDLDGLLKLDGGDTALFTAVNIQVVNGTGSTDGTPNGRGNIIVGYDAVDVDEGTDPFICSLGEYNFLASCVGNGGAWAQSHKSGSHNVVIGDQHNYSRFGGLVVGSDNNITGEWSSASGGRWNTAAGPYSSIVGGELNKTRGYATTISGGSANTADGDVSSIGGGVLGTTSGLFSSINGGFENTTNGYAATVNGGENNDASGEGASVNGGRYNSATGDYASISGGGGDTSAEGNIASGPYASIAGGAQGTAIGEGASVGGGTNNAASGDYSSINGGNSNTATNSWASVSGGRSNDATGTYSSVSGGLRNTAGGTYSSTSGGADRTAAGEADWRAGTLFENF